MSFSLPILEEDIFFLLSTWLQEEKPERKAEVTEMTESRLVLAEQKMNVSEQKERRKQKIC